MPPPRSMTRRKTYIHRAKNSRTGTIQDRSFEMKLFSMIPV